MTSIGLNYSALLMFFLKWGMVGSLFSLMLSKVMAKWMVGVKIIAVDGNAFKEM